MKALFYLFTLFISIVSNAQHTVYYTPVQMPKELNDNYYAYMHPELLAKDVAALCSQATGHTFRIQPYNGETKGIFLLIDKTYIAKSSESGHVSMNDSAIVFKARYITGISYAVYSWLHDFGFRFYLPTDQWNYIPTIQQLFVLKRDTTYAPTVHLRMFGASGGLFAVKGLDESQQFRNDWFTWYRRNRMGSEYLRIDGHMGEKFNLAHQAIIEKDTSILAPVDGKRKFSVNGKLDPTYPKGVRMFTDFIVKRFESEQQYFPDFLPFKKYMSVDPGDGLNYCHTPACQKAFPSISDQMYFVAGETMKALQSVNSKASVSTMAYSERTDTPVANIHPDIHTMVVPSAFQTITTPAEMMWRWSKKTKSFSQYDFLNIGVWTYDQPFFNLEHYAHYLNYLKRINADGLSIETSQSTFAAGIPAWYMLQHFAGNETDPEKAIDQLCMHMFEDAHQHVAAIFKMFYFNDVHLKTQHDRPSFYADELAAMIQHLQQASATPKLSKIVQQRLLQLKGYVVYLCKFYELFHDIEQREYMDKDIVNRQQKASELLNYSWQLYNYRVLHNTQINDLLKKLVADTDRWNFKKSDYSCFKGNHQKVIEKAFDTLAKRYTYQAFRNELSNDIFEQLAAQRADSLLFKTQDEAAFKSFTYAIPLYTPQATTITIRYTVGKNQTTLAQQTQYAMMGIEGDDYQFMKHHFVREKELSGEVIFQLPAGGHYKLHLAQYQSTPVQFVVHPGKSLFYLNKKALPHNGIVLQAAVETGFDNAYVALFKPFNSTPKYRLSHYSSKNTLQFFDAKGNTLEVDDKHSPLSLEVMVNNKDASDLIYFTNLVTRWPAVFYYTEPYLFFLKKPQTGNAYFKRPVSPGVGSGNRE